MKKIIFINTTEFIEAKHGKAQVIKGMVEYLLTLKSINLKIISVGTDVKQYCDLPMPTMKQVLKNMVSQLFKRKPLQEILYYAPELEGHIMNLIKLEKPDVIIFDTMRVGQYASLLQADKKILYMDDLYSKRYLGIIDAAKKYKIPMDATGNFIKKIPRLLRTISRRSLVQKVLMAYEISTLKKSECNAVTRFDTVVLISSQEVAELRVKTFKDNIVSIKPWIERREGARLPQPSGQFLLLGDLSVTHNEVSAYLFLESIVTRLITELPGASLLIVGKSASKRLLDFEARYPKVVKITGYVDDLDAVLFASTALLAPLVFGSGVKIKLIDAMSAGLPIIATPVAFEGVEFRPGPGFCSEEHFGAYPDHMRALMDLRYNQAASNDVRQQFDQYYGEQALERNYCCAFQLEEL